MAQTSGPLTDQTFTDAEWRETIGPEPAIQSDIDGTAYLLILSSSSDVATLGSISQDSIAVVGGFRHKIVAGQTQEVTIPAAITAPRTDLVGLQYDPTWSGAAPGPVRVHRIVGTEGAGVPVYDASQPGVEFMPLWAVTRSPNQALSQAGREDMRVRSGPNLYVNDESDLPPNIPIGTRVRVRLTGTDFVRVLDAQANPVWSQGRTTDSNVAYVGSLPPAGTPTYRKTYVGNVTTNGQGIGGVTFPGGPFQRGVVSIQATVGRNSATPTSAYHVQTGLATLGIVDIRVSHLTGGSMQFAPTVTVPVVVVAEGW